MNAFFQGLSAIVAAIIGLAIISVIVGCKSQAPAAISAAGQFVSGVVAAAVNPAATASTNGNNGTNLFSLPDVPGASNLLSNIGVQI